MSSKSEPLSMSEANGVVVPWLDLPDYLTEKILERLHIFGYICFGAVCRRWRSIRAAHRLRHAPAPPPTVILPWFIPHEPCEEPVLCSVGLLSGKLNDRHIPIPYGFREFLDTVEAFGGGDYKDFSALPYGWVLFDHGKLSWYEAQGYQFTLWNPITGVQIQLPTLRTSYRDLKATMSPPPRCDIFVITSDYVGIEVHLHRLGNPFWTRVDYSHNDFRYEDRIGLGLASAIHHKGKFYCFLLGEGLMVVDVDRPIEDDCITGHYFEMDQSHLPKVGPPWQGSVEERLEIFLVESNGKMLMVTKLSEYDTSNPIRTLERFELCEADLSNRRWVKVESLGDQSMFIYRNFVVSLLAVDVGVKANCIYFLDRPTYEPAPWRVFDFGTRKVADASLACPPSPYTHLMFVPSIC